MNTYYALQLCLLSIADQITHAAFFLEYLISLEISMCKNEFFIPLLPHCNHSP